MSSQETKDSSKDSGYVLRDRVRAFDGTELYRARASRADQPYLVKLVKDRNVLELTSWEHVALGTVSHDLCLRPHAVVRDDKDHILFVYEAAAFVTAEKAEEASLDPVPLAAGLLDLLRALHARGICRLGIDTSSFWLRPHKGAFVPVLVQLRPQHAIPHREIYRTGVTAHDRPRLKGDAASIAPEALLGEETDARSDLYAAGAILYEILSGVPVVTADDAWTALENRSHRPPAPLMSHRPEIPEAFSKWVAKLLSFSPSERFQTAFRRSPLLAEMVAGAAPPAEPPVLTWTVPGPSELLVPDFVGRATAIGRIEAAYEATIADGMRGVLVAGDEGLGRTRLIDELLARHRLRGIASFRARFLPDERAVYYRPFAELFRALYPPGRRIPHDVEEIASHLFPDAARPRGRAGKKAPTPPRREQVQDFLAKLVLELSHDGAPLCLVLEGYAGDDPDHRALVHALSERLHGKPVLLVATLRPGTEPLEGDVAAASASGEREGEPVVWHERIDLAPLPVRELGRMASSSVGVPELPEAVAAFLHDESHGSPLSCLELLKQGQTAPRPLEEGALVSPLLGPEDMIARRMTAISDDARLCLEAGAVLGQIFDRQALLRVAELPEDDVMAHLQSLWTLDFVRVSAAGHHLEYTFPHPAYRRAILKSASPSRRSLLHTRAAHLAEGKFKRGASETLWDIAYHFSRGAEEAKRARYNALAADHALDLFAVDAALRFFKSASQAGVPDDKLARVRPKLEGLLGLMGRESEVRGLIDAAPAAAAAQMNQDAASLLAQGKLALASTEFRKALKMLSLAMEQARRSATSCSPRRPPVLGALYRRLGSYGRAQEVLERALGIAGTSGRPAALARADLGRNLILKRDLERAGTNLRESIEIVARQDDPNLEGYCRALMGRLLVAQGKMDEALKELLAAQNAVARSGDQSGAAWVALALGAYFEEGRNDTEALAHYELAERTGADVRTRFRGTVGAARSLTRLDRVADAEAKVRAAIDASQAPGATDLGWQAYAEGGRAARIGGKLEDALHAYQRAVAAIETLMDQAPIGRNERGAFLKHDGRLKAFRGLLAVRLLVDKNPTLIEFADDDYLVSLIERFYDDRYRQRKKLSERVERMVEWLLRNRDQIRMRRAQPPPPKEAKEAPAGAPAPVQSTPRAPRVDRLEGKNLMRLAAILGSLADTEGLKGHLLDMALDISDADRGLMALLNEQNEMKPAVVRDLKGRDADDALAKLDSLRGHRDLEDAGPILSVPREADASPSLLLPLAKADTLKGGIYLQGASVKGLADHEKKYLKGFANLAVMSLDTSREHVRVLAEMGRLSKEVRRLAQESSSRGRGEDRDARREERRDDRREERRDERREERRERAPERPREPREQEPPVEETAEAAAAPAPGSEAAGDGGEQKLSRRARRTQEKTAIVDALRACDWNRKDAATKLNMSRSTLNAKLRRYNIRINRLRELPRSAEPGTMAEVPLPLEDAADASTPELATGGAEPASEAAMTSDDLFASDAGESESGSDEGEGEDPVIEGTPYDDDTDSGSGVDEEE
ncbi:MAG: AAA family ATPase [Acidobacteriota bacterium]